MSVLLVAPFLEALGVTAFIGTTAAEVVGSVELGTAIGGVVSGAVANEIGNKIDEQLPVGVKEGPKRLFNDVKATAMSLYARDPRYLIENRRKGLGIVKEQEQKVYNDIQNRQNAQNSGIINVGQTIVRDNLDRYKNLYNQLSTETEIQFVETPIYDPQQPTVLSESSNDQEETPDTDYLLKKVYEEAYDSYQYSPRDIARYIIDYSRNLAITRNPIESLKNVLEMNPSFYGLSKRITTYLSDKSVPNTEEFKRINSIYNFSNITYENFSIKRNEKGLIVVSFVDEVGDVHELEQNTGLILPSVSADLVFMGPFSRNDDLPNEFRVEDWASMDHDYFYATDGYFSREGDLRFISRLSSCLKTGRILPENRQLVENTIIYFSNISLSIGAFVNGNPPKDTSAFVEQTFSNPPEEVNKQDIFSQFGSPQALGLPPVDNYQYVSLRNEFYDIMKNEMVEYTKTDGFFNYARNNVVETGIENLNVQLN